MSSFGTGHHRTAPAWVWGDPIHQPGGGMVPPPEDEKKVLIMAPSVRLVDVGPDFAVIEIYGEFLSVPPVLYHVGNELHLALAADVWTTPDEHGVLIYSEWPPEGTHTGLVANTGTDTSGNQTFRFDGLLPETTYKVRGRFWAGSPDGVPFVASNWSDTLTFSTAQSPFTAELAHLGSTSTSVDLRALIRQDTIVRADETEWQRSPTELFDAPTSSGWITNPAGGPGPLYHTWPMNPGEGAYFRMRARVNGVLTPWSNVVYAAALNALPAPTNLTAVAQSSSSVRLDWTDNSADETGFEWEQKLGPNLWGQGDQTMIGTVAANQTYAFPWFLTGSTTYTYRVRAMRGNERSAWSNEVNVATPAPNSPPGMPQLNVTDIDATSARLNLIAYSDPDGDPHAYTQWQKRIKATQVVTHDSGWVSGGLLTTNHRTSLQPSTEYEARVRVEDSRGGQSAWSAWVSFTTRAPEIWEGTLAPAIWYAYDHRIGAGGNTWAEARGIAPTLSAPAGREPLKTPQGWEFDGIDDVFSNWSASYWGADPTALEVAFVVRIISLNAAGSLITHGSSVANHEAFHAFRFSTTQLRLRVTGPSGNSTISQDWTDMANTRVLFLCRSGKASQGTALYRRLVPAAQGLATSYAGSIPNASGIYIGGAGIRMVLCAVIGFTRKLTATEQDQFAAWAASTHGATVT